MPGESPGDKVPLTVTGPLMMPSPVRVAPRKYRYRARPGRRTKGVAHCQTAVTDSRAAGETVAGGQSHGSILDLLKATTAANCSGNRRVEAASHSQVVGPKGDDPADLKWAGIGVPGLRSPQHERAIDGLQVDAVVDDPAGANCQCFGIGGFCCEPNVNGEAPLLKVSVRTL